MKVRWQKWDPRGWFASAAEGKSGYQFPDEAAEAERARLKQTAPTTKKESSDAPIVAVIQPEFEIQRPTRAEVLERFPGNRGTSF